MLTPLVFLFVWDLGFFDAGSHSGAQSGMECSIFLSPHLECGVTGASYLPYLVIPLKE